MQAPSRGYYQAIAQSSLPVAAALAPALFLLRLALYHWRRLVGDDDSALKVIGDWVAAGFLAVAAGPFLDLLTELGWWIAGATLGETGQLALAFVQSTTVFSVMDAVAQVSLFSGILVLLMTVGGILAMAGMLFAFGAANAALYVMAVVAAPIAVAAVLRHMRWLRSLWIKAVAVIGAAAGGGWWNFQSRRDVGCLLCWRRAAVTADPLVVAVGGHGLSDRFGRYPEESDPFRQCGCFGAIEPKR